VEVDPFFEKNVITDWVMDAGAKTLYIPDELQRPWTGNRSNGDFPKKRTAGRTNTMTGVPAYVDIFVDDKRI
jgi:hypothetical protein